MGRIGAVGQVLEPEPSGPVERIKQGCWRWNSWREKDHSDAHPDLSGADLQECDLRECNLQAVNLRDANLFNTDLSEANLQDADLSRVNLQDANLYRVDLREANLFEANLSGANLSDVNLRGANLRGANLRGVNLRGVNLRDVDLSGIDLSGFDVSGLNLRRTNLRGANLRGVNLRGFDLYGIDLRDANLRGADLHGAYLSGADLSGAYLRDADLGDAYLSKTQFLRTNCAEVVFTGACLEDWNINSSTNFEGTICEYVYLKANQQERRPRRGTFKPGEFAALFQQAMDTVDLIFKDGIDWQAFFLSFQDLRDQYDDQYLAIQAIEKKRGGAFVVRVEVSEGADKSAIESSAKQLYDAQLKTLEEQYEKHLRLQGAHLEEIQSILKDERRERTRLSKVVERLADGQTVPKYDMRGTQFAGGFADTVQGSQSGGTINNHGPNTEDITRLITTLRDQAQTFPTDQKDEALDTLEALQDELAKPDPDQPRIGRRLKKLVTLGAAIARPTSDFTNKIIELTEKLGIPIEQVQLPPSSSDL